MEYVPYQLSQRAALNRLDLTTVREGVLIKHEGGYGCIQPWVELGDPSLAQCLDDLRKRNLQNRIVRQAIRSTEVLREKGAHPASPQLEIMNYASLSKGAGSMVLGALQAGYSAVKVKRGKDWMRMRKKTVALMEAFPTLRWRFDFNGALESHIELRQFLSSLPRERVDYIEDPFSTSKLAERWQGTPIAYDRVLPPEGKAPSLENAFLIAKPAVQSKEEISELAGDFPERVLFTSYMDHVVGQVFAASQAEAFYQERGVKNPPLCGLVTHGLYAETPYAQVMGESSPVFHPALKKEHFSLLKKEQWTGI